MRQSLLIGFMASVTAAMIAMVIVDAQPTQPPIGCVPDRELKEKVRNMVLDALDESLREHVRKMYHIWLKDEGTPARDRAGNGTRIGIRAYMRARADVLGWDPPLCNQR